MPLSNEVEVEVEVAHVPRNEEPVKRACAAGQCNSSTDRGLLVITSH